MTTQRAETHITDEMRATCEAYVGRGREVEDTLAPEPAEKLATLLNQGSPGDHLPPTYHWAYFAKGIELANQGADMHEKTGIFLPPAPFHRRMWAAGEVSLLHPLRIGRSATRRSRIDDVSFKTGKSGQMCFVTLSHEIEQDSALAIAEIQTIVYRDRGLPETVTEQRGDPLPDGYFRHPESQLWFYSAVTHNGHRIHWDRQFCRDVEGYPDLVVHGPLMATELCEALRDGKSSGLRFTYRALAPVFVSTAVRLALDPPGSERGGKIQRRDGVTAMSATLATL